MTPGPQSLQRDVELLPEDLREQATALLPYAHGTQGDAKVAEALRYACDAAYVRDVAAAERMVQEAESLAAEVPPPPPGNPATVIKRGLHGTVQAPGLPAEGRLLIATDAAVRMPGGRGQGKRRRRSEFIGTGYLTTAGNWGCAGSRYAGSLNPNGPGVVNVAELRAVHLALTQIPAYFGEATLMTDSVSALTFLRAWQAGRTSHMPDGYSLRPRVGEGGETLRPTLVRLAELVASTPGLRIEHVRGHRRHPLNEAADSLASLAVRCAGGKQEGDEASLTARAAGLAEAFLRTWAESVDDAGMK